jgi:endo-1,4-beta-xylanase
MRLNRRECVALGVGAMFAGAAAPKQASLDEIARSKGLRFGTAVGVGKPGAARSPFSDPKYRAVIARECGVVVPENELKLYFLKGAGPQGYDFSGADTLAAFARQHNMIYRGHTLLWNRDEFAPNWIKTHDFGGRAGAERWLRDYIGAVAGRYRDQMQSWDVVNESIDPKTGLDRETVFTKAIGPEVVEQAFFMAREAAPKAKLVYNDYMGPARSDEKHRAGVLRLLERLKKRGAPIDALGVQGHLANGDSDTNIAFTTEQQRDWRKFLDEAKGMGLDLIITEFDVNDVKGPADIAQRDALVAQVSRDFLAMMVSYPELKHILAWGMADKYSWLQTWWPRPDKLEKRGTPYDSNLRPKPMREAIAAVLRDAPARAAWA